MGHNARAIEPIALGPGEVHVWYTFPERVRDPARLAAYQALMTPEERAQYQRFVFEKDRHLYLVTRALVRTVLSRYAAVEPAAWQFTRSAHGKPEISGPPGVLWPRFNLSNTHGLVVCAVSTSHEALGVDVEGTSRGKDMLGVAESFFSPAEVNDLRALPAEVQPECFFVYWTLKESYIKARGMGLSIPLDLFSFSFDSDGDGHGDGDGHRGDGSQIRISFAPKLADEPGRWRFALLRASEQHFLALGVADDRGVGLTLRAAPACHDDLADLRAQLL